MLRISQNVPDLNCIYDQIKIVAMVKAMVAMSGPWMIPSLMSKTVDIVMMLLMMMNCLRIYISTPTVCF